MPVGIPRRTPERVVTGVTCHRSPTRSATRTSGRAPATVYATTGAPDPFTTIEGAPASDVFSTASISNEGPRPYQTPVSAVQVVWMSVPLMAMSVPLALDGVRLARDGSAAGPKGTGTPPGDSLGCATAPRFQICSDVRFASSTAPASSPSSVCRNGEPTGRATGMSPSSSCAANPK